MHDRIRILYVDDEANLLSLGKDFLEKGGEFSIDTAASAGEARALMTSGNYDAIISDYQMPGEDGITFLKSVRGSYTDIPFILFTGRGREEVVIEAINNGVDFYIQKGGDARAQFAELAHKIRHAVTRHKDAARRKIAEDALRESEAKFSRLFQSSPAILALIDITNNSFVDVNDAFVRSSGYLREDVIGRSPESLGIYVDAGTQELILAELRNGSEVSAREIPFRRKDGKVRTCLYSVVMITMGGRPYTLSSVEDITRRKAMETELRENKDLLEKALDLAHMANWERDGQTGIFTFNDRFYSLYGTTAEREGGYRKPFDVYIQEFVHPEDRARVLEEVRKVRRDSHTYTLFIEHRIVRRDGAVRVISVRTKGDYDAEGKIVKIHGVNQDITDQRKTAGVH
ncbi:MAG: PAS domain S-box protein [Methanoregula sp.]|jgi:PAS domain S-box-containing protein